jgi:predicted porin
LHNPVGGKFGKQLSEKLASVYSFGLGYDASDNCFVSTVFSKEEDQPVNIIAGMQYQFAQQFFMRIGVNSNTTSVFAGIGAGWKKMRVDIAANYHPQLGFSPGILFLCYFGNKK